MPPCSEMHEATPQVEASCAASPLGASSLSHLTARVIFGAKSAFGRSALLARSSPALLGPVNSRGRAVPRGQSRAVPAGVTLQHRPSRCTIFHLLRPPQKNPAGNSSNEGRRRDACGGASSAPPAPSPPLPSPPLQRRSLPSLRPGRAIPPEG